MNYQIPGWRKADWDNGDGDWAYDVERDESI